MIRIFVLIEEAKHKFQKVLEAYENLNNSNSRKIYDEELKDKSKNFNQNKTNDFNTIRMDNNNQKLIANRRPFSNGEMFSLFILIIIIFISLSCSILIASFTGKGLDTIPIWLIR